MLEPFAASTTGMISIAGTQNTTSTSSLTTNGFNVSTNKKEYTFTYNGNEYNSSNLNSTNYFESCGV